MVISVMYMSRSRQQTVRGLMDGDNCSVHVTITRSDAQGEQLTASFGTRYHNLLYRMGA